jgi:hypothetical protein
MFFWLVQKLSPMTASIVRCEPRISVYYIDGHTAGTVGS